MVTVIEDPTRAPRGFVWPSEIPAGCPFEQSTLFDRIYFTGRFSDYHFGDTFYPSWAEDGNLYSPYTDGTTDGVASWSIGENAATGHVVMKGDDPLKLEVKNTSMPKKGSPAPYQGRYPAGSLVYDGVWYYGTYCLTAGDGGGFINETHNGFSYNWPILGPIPGFQLSYDYGKTWMPSPLSGSKPLFPEPAKRFGAVKMGAPHFVDFGKNMQYSPDGKAYLIAMGAEDDDPTPRPCLEKKFGEPYGLCDHCPDSTFNHANLSWITADQIYLARVTPSPVTINDERAYEYFAGHDKAGKAIWSKHFKDLKPLLEWNNNMGCVTVTYVPQLKRYLMCITDGTATVANMNSYILEAEELTGTWRIISYMKDFGEQSYFLNFPSKFISDEGDQMWLSHSANFSSGTNGYELKFNPAGGRYGLSLHELRFLAPGAPAPAAEPRSTENIFEGNIAKEATVTASSAQQWHPATSAIDEAFATTRDEWVSSPTLKKLGYDNIGFKGEWIRLDWGEMRTVDRIVLFDRSDPMEQIMSGTLIFSDGSQIEVDQRLPSMAHKGLEITFDQKRIHWVMFMIKGQGWRSTSPGLAEIAVF